MASNFLETNARRSRDHDSENFSLPLTLVCSGLMSAAAWGVIAAVVMFVR